MTIIPDKLSLAIEGWHIYVESKISCLDLPGIISSPINNFPFLLKFVSILILNLSLLLYFFSILIF